MNVPGSLVHEGIMLKSIPIIFDLARTPGKRRGCSVAFTSSLNHTGQKYGNRGIFHDTIFNVVDQFLPKKKACCVPDQVRMGRDGVWLELVSQVVFWAFFEIWKPHVDHTKFPEFYTFILDNNPVVR